jgi:hypothetical protein
LEEIRQDASADMLAMFPACEPRLGDAHRRPGDHERPRQHFEFHENLPIGLVDRAFRMIGGSL